MDQTPNTSASEQDPIRSILSDWVDNQDFDTVDSYQPETLRHAADVLEVLRGETLRSTYIEAVAYVRDDLIHEYILEISLVYKDRIMHNIDNRGPDHAQYLRYNLKSAMLLTIWLDENPK